MKISTVRIISWFGNDEIRDKRKEIHNKQVDWFLSKGLKVQVFCQQYKEEDYRNDVEYIKSEFPNVLLPGTARNFLLESFYNSNEDYSFFCDNDSVLYDNIQHIDGSNFISILNEITEQNIHVDCYLPIIPMHTPFSDFAKKNEHILNKNLMFKRTYKLKGSLFVLRNLKKFYNKEVYFDQDSFTNKEGKIISGEDMGFACELISQGFGVYECKNIILKEFSTNLSTWVDDISKRLLTMDVFSVIMNKKFGIEIKNGKLDYQTWLKKKFNHPKEVLIPKAKEKGFFDL